MAVDTTITKVTYTNVVANTPIGVNIRTYDKAHINVYYGKSQLLAVIDTDYTITLNPLNYSTFTFTPKTALLTKINNLIASTPGEANEVLVKRVLPLTTDYTESDGFVRKKIADEFDLHVMMIQQLQTAYDVFTTPVEDLLALVVEAELAAAAAAASEAVATAQAVIATTQATTATTQAGIATTQATTATTQAGIATAQAGVATTQAGNAATSAATATTQAGLAATAATTATTQATTATTQAGIATTQAGIAATQASNAAASAASALASWNSFRGVYYGVLSADPTLDPLGNAVGQGDFYFSSTLLVLRVYSGTAWGSYGTSVAGRPVLSAATTIYCRADLGAATVTIATPGVWTRAAHGLVNDDPIVFCIKPDMDLVTITAASPAVCTRVAHGYAAGQPIRFSSTGYLPTGLAYNTTYYVIAAGLTADNFQVSATVGGAAINTTAISTSFTNASATITTGSAHGAVVGQKVRFAGSVATNFTAGIDYVVISVPSSTTLTVALTGGATAIVAGSTVSGGTFVQTGKHYVEKTGALPTGVIAGTVYFARNVTTNTFEFAATAGGASIATSGTQSGIFNVATGNDANDGSAADRAHAVLNLSKACSLAGALDTLTYALTIQAADSVYLTGAVLPNMVGAGVLTLKGNQTYWSNAFVNVTGSAFVFDNISSPWVADGFKVAATSYGLFCGRNARMNYQRIDFGACSTAHMLASNATMTASGPSRISGNSLIHWFLSLSGKIADAGTVIDFLNTPTISNAVAQMDGLSLAQLNNGTISGNCVGQKFAVTFLSGLTVNGAGVDYLPGTVAGNVDASSKYV